MGDTVRVRTTRLVTGIVMAILATLFFVSPLMAIDSAGGTQAYSAKSPIDNGRVVVLDDAGRQTVRVATKGDKQALFGITVDSSRLSVTLSSGDLQNETYVAVSGTHPAIVSTQGGAIKTGDYLMMSSIDGVLMRADFEKTTVFGRANSDFDGKSDVTLGTTVLTDSEGGKRSVVLGSVQATIDIKQNPNEKTTKTKVPEFLERVGQAIAEKEVSAVRIYLSMAITAVSLIASIAVVYAGVRNGIISIGRNPMSRRSIMRALTEVIITSILILIIGLFAVYLLLRL